MATVESSFMNTINSFIHERGCTVTGLLFIVSLLECVPVRLLWPQRDWLKALKEIHPFKHRLLLRIISNNQVDYDPFD